MTGSTEPVRLPMAPGDVAIQAHANGAVVVVDAEQRSRFVPLAEAVALAEGCARSGATVFLAWEDDSPLVADALAAVRAAGAPLQEYGTVLPPFRWPNGTTALMTAAAHGQQAILQDLLDRGAPTDARDVAGATALHHAAGAGEGAAVDALLAAGAAVDAVDHQGLTPLAVAAANGRADVVGQLRRAGADPAAADAVGAPISAGTGAPAAVRFRSSHWVPVLGDAWSALVVAALVAVLLWGVSALLAGLAAVVVTAAALRWMRPSSLYWRGAVPRRIEGTTLVARRPLGGTVRLDLRSVRAAAVSEATGLRMLSARIGGRLLVLVQDEVGPATDRRALEQVPLPGDEAAELAGRGPRALGLVLGLAATDEVLRAVGPTLVGADAYLPVRVRRAIAAAQRARPT